MIILDLPISTNYLYRRTRYTVVLTNDAMAYKQYAQIISKRQWDNEPLEGEVSVTCRFYNARQDIDNMCKLLLDSMNGIVWVDDKFIVELHLYKIKDDHGKRVEIEACVVK